VRKLLWQYGERHYNAKRFSEAADWFISGSHPVINSSCPTSTVKCYRKAALCYIEQREFARAATVMRRCSTDDAPSHYVMFLAAIYQGLCPNTPTHRSKRLDIQFPAGLEAEGWYINGVLRGSLTNSAVAIKSLHDMRSTPGFDRKMLLLATQISHQMESKGVLLFVLEALLETLVAGSEAACSETVAEAMTLIRCIIRLVLKLMSDPTANQYVISLRWHESAISDQSVIPPQTYPDRHCDQAFSHR